MPIAKKRRKSGSAKKREPFRPAPPPQDGRWSMKLNGSKLVYLKNDPDFLTWIKMGRAINAVNFASSVLADAMYEKTFVEKRQYRRGIFVLAGYLHQALKVVNGIKEKYLLFKAFDPLRSIMLDMEHKKARDYVRKIRNFVAFHLDEFDTDDRTARMLGKLKPQTYTLMATDDNTYLTFYFEFADQLDFAFLVDEFSNGRSIEETGNDIVATILDLSFKYITAAHDFQIALAKKMELKEYIYR